MVKVGMVCRSSPELGDPSVTQQLNKHGRPVRRGAGKKKTVVGYVDSAIIDAEDDEPIALPSEDEDGEIVKPSRTRKRKRSPSPAPPPLEPIIRDEKPDEPSDDEDGGMFRRNNADTPIVFSINVPLGYHGPIDIRFTKENLINALDAAGHNAYPSKNTIKTQSPDSPTEATDGTVAKASRKGFKDFPPEIRNKIYDYVFVADEDLKFHCPNNFCRSAQFLRTCRMVFEEGCVILYSKNRFVIDRNRHQRPLLWEAVQKEIGYKDIRQFLKMIGPENRTYLRDIKITFEDASPAATPYLPDHESRRFLNDKHLIDCLRLLRGTKLRKLTINFHGRRTIGRSDIKFLSYLEEIKADEVTSDERVRWYSLNKIHEDVLKELKEVMVRKKKLYPNHVEKK